MTGHTRLGVALARHVTDTAASGSGAFILIEGLAIDAAVALARAWPRDGLELAVASDDPSRFGAKALTGAATGKRNENARGVCVVVVEGQRLADRQSLNGFHNVAPADLLAGMDSLAVLAQAETPAPMDGPAREVRSAIAQMPAADRPGALAVAAYFDALASGRPPLSALPLVGAFRDDAAGERVPAARIRENLALARRRQSEELQSHGGLADVRQRAERVLARRSNGALSADEVMRMLQDGDDQLLDALDFGEAREILERRQQTKLADVVAQELDDYERTRTATRPDAPEVPWPRYAEAARHLAVPDERQYAAGELLGFDDAEGRHCFTRGTRRKLERLLKDRVVSASDPSCPEYGLLQAAKALDGGLQRIQLISPRPLAANAKPSRSNAGRALTLACARLRLGGLLTQLQDGFGVEVDAALRGHAEPPWPESFQDAELNGAGKLATLQLRLHGNRDVLVLEWRPDLDDLAALRGAVAFAEERSLTLFTPDAPSLNNFCAGAELIREVANPDLVGVADELRRCAQLSLADGFDPDVLDGWARAWRGAIEVEQGRKRTALAESLSLAGAVVGRDAVALTPWAPLKIEWLSQYLDALWSHLFSVLHGVDEDEPLEDTARGTARATAAHYPAYVRVSWTDRPLLPTSETRIWSLYGGEAAESARHGGPALRSVLQRLLRLQPEAAGHLRCVAMGPGAADLLVEQAIRLIGTKVAGAEVGKIEIFCIGDDPSLRPQAETLAAADDALPGIGRDRLELRYLHTTQDARDRLRVPGSTAPVVHLALVCGLTADAARLSIEHPDVPFPQKTTEALFVPRTSIRPRKTRRMLLAPPASTDTGRAWLELMHALGDDEWPEDGLRIPELRTVGADLREPLRDAHDLGLWVATLDPYATRDALQMAMGDDVAILHQDRRLGGESPLSLVISQREGGPADRAIARSLQSAGIVSDRAAAEGVGAELRKVASQGYGILALEAATTGAGINELVGHVVAFSMLATRTTPWPLPPGCRILLISLDDYQYWFPNKRADLLVLAIDEASRGVHGAVVEVKARRSDAGVAATDAVDQLRQTLQATRWAGYPDNETIHSRLWLNRIAEAAVAVARESNLRLSEAELDALETFRRGLGSLEWAGIGLVFGPNLEELHRDRQQEIAGDLVPISVSAIRLTEPLLRSAAGTRLDELRTVEASRPPLDGGRRRRRPERAPDAVELGEDDASTVPAEQERPGAAEQVPRDEERPVEIPEPDERPLDTEPASLDDTSVESQDLDTAPTSQEKPATASTVDDRDEALGPRFNPPTLGWDADTGQPVLWHAAGDDALSNGHMEIWGSSGAGKTQFVMALLSQLAAVTGARFGIADFKNDYGRGFPSQADADFVDLWEGASYNPLALPSNRERDVRAAVIELRDIVDVATQSFTRMGIRQKQKLRDALEEAYRIGQEEGRWPTLSTLHSLLDDDLRGIIGDLTGEPIFGDGLPLGDVIQQNTIFGLSQIPGNGLTTVLAAGFILAALQLRIQGLEPVPNTIRYAVVVDEAHRVSSFKAVDTMVREGRSKGLAVILATQQPGDLGEVVSSNAQSRICFRLSDATVARAAANKLDQGDRSLPEQIRTLGAGEAFVSLGGEAPRLLRMAQNWRDRAKLDLAP